MVNKNIAKKKSIEKMGEKFGKKSMFLFAHEKEDKSLNGRKKTHLNFFFRSANMAIPSFW